MFKKNLIFFAFAVLFLSQTFFAQGTLNGTVTDVIDGKTLQVENQSGKTFYLKLRYLEVPEAEQPLSSIVKNHLKDLAFGKTIYIKNVRVLPEYTIGVALLDKVDLSQQMIRDGAGWFDISESDSVGDSTNVYKETEALAKSEKLGVWNVKGLKPAWEFRAEKEAKSVKTSPVEKPVEKVETKKTLDDLSLAESVKAASQPNAKSNATVTKQMMIYDFSQMFSGEKDKNMSFSGDVSNSATELPNVSGNVDSNNLMQFYNPNINRGYTLTKFLKFNLQSSNNSKESVMVFGYDYQLKDSAKQYTAMGFLLFVGTKNGVPIGKNNLYLYADGKSVTTGKGVYDIATRGSNSIEFFGFRQLPKSSFLQIAKSKTVVISVGKYKRVLNDEEKEAILNVARTLE